MGDDERGQVDTSAAVVYEDLFVPALFGRFSDAVARAANVGPTDDVLDVACGTGALTRSLRGSTAGRVVGVDVNPAMVAVARRHGSAIEFEEGDALELPFDDRTFDLATCQFGLMFLADPSAGLREMARVGARGAVAVWDSIERSDGYSAMQEFFRDELGEEAATSLDAPFAMGAPGALERIVDDAGLTRVEFTSVQGSGRFDSIEQWVTTEIRGWTLGDRVSEAQLEGLVEVAATRLAEFGSPDGCGFGMAARVVTW